jgi:hypothetical protein
MPAYRGRIPRPQPPPGPGEVETPDKPMESEQAHKAILDITKEDKEKHYKKKYRANFWRWTGIIVGSPIMLVMTYYLFKRRTCISEKACGTTTALTLLCSIPGRRTQETYPRR